MRRMCKSDRSRGDFCNRGVAYDNGKVFIGRLDAVLVALDAATGGVIWKSTVADFRQNFTVTMAPQIVAGKVIVGVSGGEFEVRGRVLAFDADTGQRLWTFFTVPPAGPSASTWAGSSWRHGGGPVWTTPAVDPALGLVYITTGNASRSQRQPAPGG
jgi:quinohemoprotein ethanol dehydrogenase